MTSNSTIPNIKKKLEELLNTCRAAKGGTEFTHVSMGGIAFPGKFIFDSKHLNKLIKYLAQAAENDIHYSIAEKLQEHAPIMVDVDLRMPIDTPNGRLYDDNMINQIIIKYRTSIQKYLKVTNNELTCFIFEKKNVSEKNGEIADGIHIIFPYIVTNTKIRHLVFKDVYDNTTEMFNTFSNASSVLDDKIVSTNPWLMYGCCKPSGIPYVLTKIYDYNNLLIEHGSTKDIIGLLSLQDSKWSQSNATPLLTNINLDYIETEYKSLMIDSDNYEKIDEMIPTDRLELIEKSIALTNMLSKKRANNFHEWIRVGWALHNTHSCLSETWIIFSKQSTKFIIGECNKLWNNMKNDGYTIRSLMLWAKEDSPDEYKQFIKNDFINNLKKNSINNTFMIAKALYSKYFDKFVCANPKDNCWYNFSEHRWRKCSSGGRLITLISSEFANHYIMMAQEFSQKALEMVNPSDKKNSLQEASNFNKIADNLMDINFKKKNNGRS